MIYSRTTLVPLMLANFSRKTPSESMGVEARWRPLDRYQSLVWLTKSGSELSFGMLNTLL